MRSPRYKLTLALALSLAVHGLLFIKGEPAQPFLSERSIIHARLDKQNRELIQEQQAGQISQQQDNKISEANTSAEKQIESVIEPDQPPIKQTAQETKAIELSAQKPKIDTKAKTDKKISNREAQQEPKEKPKKEPKKEPVLEELSETQIQQPPQKQSQQQKSQISSDSRAQVEALEGSEDPTYTSYRKVLSQYLAQRLEAQPTLQGRVRLKIKLEYGSFATQVNIIESSGNLQLDNWARKAALAANPYPKIPKEIGLIFEFSPTLQLGEKP